MKKIAFYINTVGYGGAERVICNLATNFSKKNYDVFLITSYPIDKEYSYGERVKRINLEEERINGFIKRNIILARKLRHLLKKEKIDTLITFMAEPNYRGIISSFGLKNKVIISVRNDPNKEYPTIVHRLLAKFLFCFADGTVFQTEDARKWFPSKIRRNSCIIINQVKEEFFRVEKEKELYYVAVGRLVPQKNYPLMIHGFAEFLKISPNEQLHIYGDGDSMQYTTLINTLGISENIHFMGKTDDVVKVLKNAKAFLMTSDFEGMPNSLLEAMAVGLPCICTDCPCGGPRSVIENEINGVLIPVKSKDELTNALCRMDSEMRSYLGANAKQSALNFHPEIVSEEWIKYINEIV